MVAALSTGNQIGLAGTGAAFIIFALLSSFVFPRFDPNFPSKKGLRWYLPLAGLFFLAMISAVLVFGKEKKESEASAATNPPAQTTPAPTPLTTGPYANGDATAGKASFAKNGCAGCHTLAAAAATGKIGPSLDDLPASAAKAGKPLGAFIAESIADPDAYIAPGYTGGQMPPFGKTLKPAEIADLVAFVYGSVSKS